MLAIRMQRTGRKGHAQFRVIVQDSRFHPSSGRVVAYVGNYDPHAKTATLDGTKISTYLENGAQPSERVVKLLQKEGIKLPKWVVEPAKKEKATRNPDKRRSTRPAGAPEPEAKPAEAEAPAPTSEESESRTPGEEGVGTEETAPADSSAEASAKAEEKTTE